MSEREQFESHFGFDASERQGDVYSGVMDSALWGGWKARADLAAEREREISDHELDLRTMLIDMHDERERELVEQIDILLAYAELKYGNLDPDANLAFEAARKIRDKGKGEQE